MGSGSGDSHGRPLPLHTCVVKRRAYANRIFALIYFFAILSLLYHHWLALFHSFSIVSITILLADLAAVFMWATSAPFRMRPVNRRVFIENLEQYADEADYPRLDVFICTADPHKEPPMGVVNTALSVMAFDYPAEKLSVYVSDDGGSQLTLFAFMEAARFAAHWLPYCRRNKIVDRSPAAYFGSDHSWFPGTDEIKMMYEKMRCRVENVVETGRVRSDNYMSNEGEIHEVFSRWTDEFTPKNHPPAIQVLLEESKDKDVSGHVMPNLVYVSRGKSTNVPHHFKAGALNVLLRVSATMTNAPVILTLDADMYSNDPRTPLRVLCYLLDPAMDPHLGYVQFPQVFHGINKNDIYGGQLKLEFHIQACGMDGFSGPSYVGTGCFFRRRVLFGGPSDPPGDQEHPVMMQDKSISSKEVLAVAHRVADCDFEQHTKWGIETGFMYGSLVEDFFTGYRLQCKGWRPIFCSPKRPAFLGDSPINLHGLLSQLMRWNVGLLEVAFSRYSPITFGVKSMNPLQGLCYTHYAFWSLWSIPITIYAFVPQLALLNSTSIFPKASDPYWFYLYIFLFMGANGQECLEFMLAGESFQRWWNNQRMWAIRGLSSFSFALVEFLLKFVGISSFGFSITSKVVEEEQSKRYKLGIFEFGVESPLFLPITTAALINLASFIWGTLQVVIFEQRSFDDLFLQMILAIYSIINCWPLYEAMVLRTDEGKMPLKITLISVTLACTLYLVTSFAF